MASPGTIEVKRDIHLKTKTTVCSFKSGGICEVILEGEWHPELIAFGLVVSLTWPRFATGPCGFWIILEIHMCGGHEQLAIGTVQSVFGAPNMQITAVRNTP